MMTFNQRSDKPIGLNTRIEVLAGRFLEGLDRHQWGSCQIMKLSPHALLYLRGNVLWTRNPRHFDFCFGSPE